LEATLPPESRPIASASLHPLAHSTAPVTARPLWEPVLYAVGTFIVLVLGGLSIQRGRESRNAHGDRDGRGVIASAASHAATNANAKSGASACEPGKIAAGGGSVHLGLEGDQDDPARDVTLSAFCIDKEAVSTSAYTACSDRGDCLPASRTNEWEGIGPDDHEVLDPFCSARDPSPSARPVNCVTWEMAETFCAKSGGRLPTEAEWELASRSTAASVAEWMSDWRAPLVAGAAVNPTGPSGGDEHVVRGAHAIGAAATRFGAAPATKSHAIGFRCVKAP
jgi:formylglycine-generating enzyme required for sulfatase activity